MQYNESQQLHQETLESAIQKSDMLKLKNQKLEVKLHKLNEKYKRYKIAYKKARDSEKELMKKLDMV